MKIVHVLTRLLKAGSEENTLASCRAQMTDGHEVFVVHGRDFDKEVKNAASLSAVDVICLEELVHPISPWDDLHAISRMIGLFKTLRPDIVHTHQSKAGILGRVAARRARVPGIVHGVHILPFANVGKVQELIYVAAERYAAQFTNAFINVSPSVRDACIERKIGSRKSHFVAYSAMEVERFKTGAVPSDWRQLLGVAEAQPKPPTALMLAAFEPRKRHIDFIRAMPQAFRHLSDWRVIFAGRGETEPEARALVSTLGLENNVIFAGFRPDPESLIALADVGILTSLREGLPRVVVQYAAGGKPSVITDLHGINDIVEHDVSAIITPAGDINAAASAVARLLADPNECARLAAGARAINVDQWSPSSMNSAIYTAYNSVSSK